MELISWERDKLGSPACTQLPRAARFITASAAAAIVKNLMHEVTTISASFEVEDLVVFSRLAGISMFGEKHAEYYGLYASSGAAEGVNYCLRRCTWERVFRTTEEVLKALSAQVLFFDVKRLEANHRDVVIAADREAKDEYQIRSEPSKNHDFLGKQVSYFVTDDRKELSGTYRAESSTNVAVERLFQKLQMVFGALSVDGAVDPLPDSLRVSYSFFSIAETVGLTT